MDRKYVEKINFLIGDEYEAIDGYDEVIGFFNNSEEPNKDIIINQLKHIREEEEEHIKELNELKKVLLKPSYKPDLDTLKEAKDKQPKKKQTYMYNGPIGRFGKVVEWDWEGTTKAVSEKEALSHLAFKAGEYLGLDVGSHNVKIELDPDCVYKTQDEDAGYFDDIPRNKTTGPICDKCGTQLTDGGYCPVCDDGEQDY